MRRLAIVTILLITLAVVLRGFTVPAPESVSLVQLIANPQQYDNKEVIVTAYLQLGEWPSLFLHEEDWKNSIAANSIWIEPNDSMKGHFAELNGKYVQVQGLFRSKAQGRRGTIYAVRQYQTWPDNSLVHWKADATK